MKKIFVVLLFYILPVVGGNSSSDPETFRKRLYAVNEDGSLAKGASAKNYKISVKSWTLKKLVLYIQDYYKILKQVDNSELTKEQRKKAEKTKQQLEQQITGAKFGSPGRVKTATQLLNILVTLNQQGKDKANEGLCRPAVQGLFNIDECLEDAKNRSARFRKVLGINDTSVTFRRCFNRDFTEKPNVANWLRPTDTRHVSLESFPTIVRCFASDVENVVKFNTQLTRLKKNQDNAQQVTTTQRCIDKSMFQIKAYCSYFAANPEKKAISSCDNDVAGIFPVILSVIVDNRKKFKDKTLADLYDCLCTLENYSARPASLGKRLRKSK
ncbi:MAG: hypothetical protein LBD36_01035 [Holosporales bacterium]|jgi:hypothetical protein|nr:hypothetical protein [Holosporales bacterium]